VADRDFPFVEGFAAEVSIGGEEGFLGPVEVAALGIELLLHVDELAVGQEVAESPEEGEGALVDDGMGAAFDEGEFGERFLGQEFLVAEADEPFADLFGRKAEIGGSELLVEARVTHAGIDEDAFPGEDGEEVLLGVHGFHV
jgi:hypothetical protein